jgi:hypothetical protein
VRAVNSSIIAWRMDGGTLPVSGLTALGPSVAATVSSTSRKTVNLSGVYAFEISGPCSWYRVG